MPRPGDSGFFPFELNLLLQANSEETFLVVACNEYQRCRWSQQCRSARSLFLAQREQYSLYDLQGTWFHEGETQLFPTLKSFASWLAVCVIRQAPLARRQSRANTNGQSAARIIVKLAPRHAIWQEYRAQRGALVARRDFSDGPLGLLVGLDGTSRGSVCWIAFTLARATKQKPGQSAYSRFLFCATPALKRSP